MSIKWPLLKFNAKIPFAITKLVANSVSGFGYKDPFLNFDGFPVKRWISVCSDHH